ncbi:MAG: hypothetical protein CME64_10635 [Halobacteriovoraceae bacterium]|nr:hypothetical protein [Halobacteriovoraceae bacterium]|tara:strand:- start:55285 stop:56052 length:768 start_codon:yes stop_codon:yes gene_type:complete
MAIIWPKGPADSKSEVSQKPHQFRVNSIRTVGEPEKKNKNMVHIPKQIKTKDPIKKKQAPKGKELSLADLSAKPSKVTPPTNPVKQAKEVGTKPIQALSLDNKSVQNFMQSTPNAGAAGEYAKAFGESDVMVEMEVPKGVPEDELNKYELVFYSFRKRTALNYINAFYNELNDFQRANPHLRFPLTEDKESMTGRITYDEKGDIVRIKMLRWTNKKKLQDFFLQVLKNMNTLPNPPEIIIKDGEFHVYYSLTVNG